MTKTASPWWWLSFATDAGFLGIVLVRAPDFMFAVRETQRLGCNPGGEVRGWPVSAGLELGDPRAFWVGRLLSREEADVMSREWTKQPIVSTQDLEPDGFVEPSVLDETENEGQ